MGFIKLLVPLTAIWRGAGQFVNWNCPIINKLNEKCYEFISENFSISDCMVTLYYTLRFMVRSYRGLVLIREIEGFN